MLLVMGCAPHSSGLVSARNMFVMRAAQLVVTPGLYCHLVAELRLSIVVTMRVTALAPSENVSVKDVACLFTVDGVTIPQVLDAHEWGTLVLSNTLSGVDASQRTEAMMAPAEV
jgi:hypothetical protein